MTRRITQNEETKIKWNETELLLCDDADDDDTNVVVGDKTKSC